MKTNVFQIAISQTKQNKTELDNYDSNINYCTFSESEVNNQLEKFHFIMKLIHCKYWKHLQEESEH